MNDLNPQYQTSYQTLYKDNSISYDVSSSNINNKLNTTFNPLTHFPPTYNLLGYQITRNKNQRYNILQYKHNIPKIWAQNKPASSTRTGLLEKRRKESLPDISYDLDGDGIVSQRDYFLSKMFDIDKKGKLNNEERKNALEAINNRFEENFFYNTSGGKTERLLQKRGKFIQSEDFLPVKDSYPVHPLSKVTPKNGIYTLTDLKNFRKNRTIEEIISQQKQSETKTNNSYEEYRTKYLQFQNEPKYTSIKQIKEKQHKEARKQAGLLEDNTDFKNAKLPSLKYIYNPINKSPKDISNKFLKESKSASSLLLASKHRSSEQRIKEREDEIFRMLYKKEEGLTHKKLKEKKRSENNAYNISQFAHSVKGIHGHELPKFANSEKPFWKMNDAYKENPKYNSQIEYLERRKFWKKQEDLLLSEHKEIDDKDLTFDPYNRVKVLQKKQNIENIIPNVNKLNFYKDFDPNKYRIIDYKKGKIHVYRWTSLLHKFSLHSFKNGRLFDIIQDQEYQRALESERINKKLKRYLESKEPKKVDLNLTKTKSVKSELVTEKNSLLKKFTLNNGNNSSLYKTTLRNKGF